MKNILITSSGVARRTMREEIAKIIPSSKYPNLAYISTASKVVKDPTYSFTDKQKLIGLDLNVTEIDIAVIQGEQLENSLRENDAIYVQGGNPYWLLKQMRESKFDYIVPQLIQEGMPYIGKSAGAYILAPEVIVPTWYENTWKTFGITDLTGMNIVPFIWAAHFDPDNSTMIHDVKVGMQSSKYPVRVITNDQALWVNEDEVHFIGDGEEFLLK